ncbi:phage tail protein [Escherichia coli]|nr:phage tail protein [Escherichia coli]
MRFLMMLALRMGRTLSELRREMSASEIMMWAEFDRFSPLGTNGLISGCPDCFSYLRCAGVKVSLNDALLQWEKEQTEGASDPFAGLENALLIVSQ